MEIKDMNNSELYRHYSSLLIEIDSKYKQKKEFEEEIKKRFRNGQLKEEIQDGIEV